jgi:hypothetical protein
VSCAADDARHPSSAVAFATSDRGRGSHASAASAAPLDLHEGIDTHPLREGCKRWPEHLKLLNATTGELVPGRCRATNLCRYCQKLYVIETVEMLTLDAMEHAPSLWLVLTAREHLTRAECRRHLDMIRRAVQKRWPGIEWFVQVEFQRRGALHLNLLIKGVPVEHLEQLYDAVTTRWCSRVDAIAAPFDRMHEGGQWAGEVGDGVGVVRYVSKMLAHGLKAEQAPPLGWRGHRTSQTRGYLVRPASVMREEARAALREKRRLHKAIGIAADVAGTDAPPADLVEHVYEQLEAADSSASWSLYTERMQLRNGSTKAVVSGRDDQKQRADAARRPFKTARLTASTGTRLRPKGTTTEPTELNGTCADDESVVGGETARGGVRGPAHAGSAPPPPPPPPKCHSLNE